MRRPTSCTTVDRFPLPPGAGRGEGMPRGFSLVELLVVISIILVLVGLTGAALASARAGQKRLATQALIGKLDAIIGQQFASYATRPTPGLTPEARSLALRRTATADLPDRWVDVEYMANNAGQFTSPHQRAYIAVWNSMAPKPTVAYAGAECLFMIIMRGGIADCLNCSDLVSGNIGDKDGDGAFEFWDAWGNPVGYILWPAALQLPGGSGTAFFGTGVPFLPGASGRTMRPLIYSAGADTDDSAPTPPNDGDFGFTCNASQGNLASVSACGDPTQTPTKDFAKPLAGATDNITNFDEQAKR